MRETRLIYNNDKIEIKADPEAIDQLPSGMREAVIEALIRGNKTDPTIAMLSRQLTDPNLPEDFKKQLSEALLTRMKQGPKPDPDFIKTLEFANAPPEATIIYNGQRIGMQIVNSKNDLPSNPIEFETLVSNKVSSGYVFVLSRPNREQLNITLSKSKEISKKVVNTLKELEASLRNWLDTNKFSEVVLKDDEQNSKEDVLFVMGDSSAIESINTLFKQLFKSYLRNATSDLPFFRNSGSNVNEKSEELDMPVQCALQ
jgi:hypothetical protein